MERLICIVIGYIFGLIQSGYLYGKANHMDIRQYGSGNAGSTNVLRVMGKKALLYDTGSGQTADIRCVCQ